MIDFVNFPAGRASVINSASLFVSVCVLFPVAGMMSDWYGRKRVMYVGGVCTCLWSPFMVAVVGRGNGVAAFFAQSTLGVAMSLWGAPMNAWLVESFPSHVRLTSVAIGYNVAMAVFGGSSAALATALADRYGGKAVGFLISFVAVLAMIGLWLQPRQQTERSRRAHVVLADLELDTEESGMMGENDNGVGVSSGPGARGLRRKGAREVVCANEEEDEMEMI